MFGKVGWEAELQTHFHQVSGTVRILDEYTLEVEHFYYDGGGPAVYFWLDGPNPISGGRTYLLGSSVGQRLNGMPWDDAYIATLDTGGISLADVEGISVWCEDFKVSFGDGLFMAVPEPGNAALRLTGLLVPALLAARRRRLSV